MSTEFREKEEEMCVKFSSMKSKRLEYWLMINQKPTFGLLENLENLHCEIAFISLERKISWITEVTKIVSTATAHTTIAMEVTVAVIVAISPHLNDR